MCKIKNLRKVDQYSIDQEVINQFSQKGQDSWEKITTVLEVTENNELKELLKLLVYNVLWMYMPGRVIGNRLMTYLNSAIGDIDTIVSDIILQSDVISYEKKPVEEVQNALRIVLEDLEHVSKCYELTLIRNIKTGFTFITFEVGNDKYEPRDVLTTVREKLDIITMLDVKQDRNLADALDLVSEILSPSRIK